MDGIREVSTGGNTDGEGQSLSTNDDIGGEDRQDLRGIETESRETGRNPIDPETGKRRRGRPRRIDSGDYNGGGAGETEGRAKRRKTASLVTLDSPAVGYTKLFTNYIASTRPEVVRPLYIRSDEECLVLADRGLKLWQEVAPKQLLELSPKASAGLSLVTAVLVMYGPAVMMELEYRRQIIAERANRTRKGVGEKVSETPTEESSSKPADFDGLYARPSSAIPV